MTMLETTVEMSVKLYRVHLLRKLIRAQAELNKSDPHDALVWAGLEQARSIIKKTP